MTRRSSMPEAPDPPTSSPDVTRRAIGHVFDLTRAVLADPSILDEIPNGVTLVLLPDDPEVAAQQIEAGLFALREGRDVLFRLVRPSPGEGGNR